MTDREHQALDDAVNAIVGADIELSRLHPAVFRKQNSDDTVDVDLDDGGPWPRASRVEPKFGLPATRVRFAEGARMRIAHDNGDPRKRIALAYDQYPPQFTDAEIPDPPPPVLEINIAGANAEQKAARKTDPTSNGAIIFRQVPAGPGGVPTTLTISHRSVSGAETPIISVVLPGPAVILSPDPLEPTAAIMNLPGEITDGSSIVKIGG